MSKGVYAQVKDFTTKEAREDYQTMRIMEFLSKYKVSYYKAKSALGNRKSKENYILLDFYSKVDTIGREVVMESIKAIGEKPTSIKYGLSLNMIRTRLNGKVKKRYQTYKKFVMERKLNI